MLTIVVIVTSANLVITVAVAVGAIYFVKKAKKETAILKEKLNKAHTLLKTFTTALQSL